MTSPLAAYAALEGLVDPAPPEDAPLFEALGRYAEEVLPAGRGAELEARGAFPERELRAFAERGLARELAPEDVGGRLEWSRALRLCSRLAAHELDVTLCLGGAVLGALPVLVCGDAAQRAAYFGALLRGEMGGLALSEWAHGSDLLANEVTAVPVDDAATGYRLTGTKGPINNGGRGAYVVVLARTDRADHVFSHTLFLVPRGTPGYEAGPKFASLGYRCMDLTRVRLEGAVVPSEAVLGTLGEGFTHARRALEVSRSGVAAMALGPMAAALAHALDHARGRVLYGAPAVALEGVRALLARCFARTCVAIAAGRRAARAVARWAVPARSLSCASKYLCPSLLEAILHDAGTVLGARSLFEDLPFARLRRSAPVLAIFDGSSQLQLAELWRHVAAWREPGAVSPEEAIALARELADPAPALVAPFDVLRDDQGQIARLSPPAMLHALNACEPELRLGPWPEAAGLLARMAANLRGAPQDVQFRLSEVAAPFYGVVGLAEAIALARADGRTNDGEVERRRALLGALRLHLAESAAPLAAALIELGEGAGVAASDLPARLLEEARHAPLARRVAFAELDALLP